VGTEKSEDIHRAQKVGSQGQLDRAIDELRQLLDNSPNDANVYTAIGDLYLTNKLAPEAIAAYSQAAGFFIRGGSALKAIAAYKKILKTDPSRGDVYVLLGELNSERGLMSNSIADYLSGAKLYLKAGNNKESLAVYRKITKINPHNTSVRLRVADLCVRERLIDEAVEEYLQAGAEYERLQKAGDARTTYEKILKVSPNHPEVLRRLGLAAFTASTPAVEAATPSAGLAEEPTAAELAGTIEFNPEVLALEIPSAPAPPVEAVADAELLPVAEVVIPAIEVGSEALIEEEPAVEAEASKKVDGEFDAILQEFRKGIKDQLEDEDFETHYDLGIAYKEMGLPAEAIEEFQVAAQGPTRFIDSATMIAACYKDQGLQQAAVACLENALADSRCKGPTAPFLKYDLALLYEEEGNTDKAVELYTSIPTIRDASARLAKLQGAESSDEEPGRKSSHRISYL